MITPAGESRVPGVLVSEHSCWVVVIQEWLFLFFKILSFSSLSLSFTEICQEQMLGEDELVVPVYLLEVQILPLKKKQKAVRTLSE